MSQRRRISETEGQKAISDFLTGDQATETVATAVRFLLEELAQQAPGNTVEVRVPPYGATQCVEGPSHSRGTPAHVVEMNPDTWLRIALGLASWEEMISRGKISASGNRADLSTLLPIFVL